MSTDRQIVVLLARLQSGDSAQAWREFLDQYAAIILQTIRFGEPDPDNAAEAFVYVCEQLNRKQCRRLRKFQVAGPASFRTWLTAVVRNLHADWRRHRYGRRRPLRVEERMSSLEAEVFRLRFELGADEERLVQALQVRFPGADRETLIAVEERIRELIGTRERARAQERAQRSAVESPVALEELLDTGRDPHAGGADPEQSASSAELRAALAGALRQLEPGERFLLQMRFGQELTLQEIARVMRLKDPQTADRRLREVIVKLQRTMHVSGGKGTASSV